MADFIHKRKLVSNTEKDILSLFGFDQAIQSFILSIYEAEQNSLNTDNHNRTFQQNIASKFIPKHISNKSGKKKIILKSGKKAEISWILPLILSRLSKNIFKKSKFFQNKDKNQADISNNNKNRQMHKFYPLILKKS